MTNYKVPVITGTSLTTGDLLRWDGSNWVNYADSNYDLAAHTHDGDILQLDGVNSDGGAFLFNTTGVVTFNQSIVSANYTAANLLTACATNAGALDFSAASKTLTVENNAIVSQDYSVDGTPQFGQIRVGHDSGNGLVDIAKAAGAATSVTRTFSTNTGASSYWDFVKSHSDSLDTYVETIDDDVLGILRFFGVDDVPSLQMGAAITAKQNGAASTGFIPTDLTFITASAAAFNSDQLVLHHDGGVGIGEDAPGQTGYAKLEIKGTHASADGPHTIWKTTEDEYPVQQVMAWAHNNTAITFDAYYDGAHKSSNAGSNARIHKITNLLKFRYDSGVAQGETVTWNDALIIDLVDGGISMPNMKSGTDQANAGAAANELWVDTDDDNTIKLGT